MRNSPTELIRHGAGRRNRTPVYCLEDNGSTIELYPLKSIFLCQRTNGRGSRNRTEDACAQDRRITTFPNPENQKALRIFRSEGLNSLVLESSSTDRSAACDCRLRLSASLAALSRNGLLFARLKSQVNESNCRMSNLFGGSGEVRTLNAWVWKPLAMPICLHSRMVGLLRFELRL